MNIKILQVKLLLLILLAFAFSASPLSANCLELYEADPSGGWNVHVSADYHATELESTDQYLSGDGTEDWRAMHDLDGDLYGFTIMATPPVLGKRVTVDLSYLTGSLSGNFNTREISPTPEGPYPGRVKFDRDEWELGANIHILNAVYARLAYSTYEMEGDWVYTGGGPNEPQKYEFDAYTIGAGFRQDFYLQPDTVPDRKLGVLVNAFVGVSFFEYEHTEQLTGASVETDGLGYEMSAELLGVYKVNIVGNSRIFAGVGYTYKNNDDGILDLTDKGFTPKVGMEIAF